MTVDTSRLSPSDAVVAIRSLPRRLRGVVATLGDRDSGLDPEEMSRRAGPDGASTHDHLVATIGVLSLFDRALEQVTVSADAVLHPGVADASAREWTRQDTPLDVLLDDLEATATRFAARVARVSTDDWSRRARVAGQKGDQSALGLVRAAVAAASDHLRAATAAAEAARRNRG